jgi:hypothetical protein
MRWPISESAAANASDIEQTIDAAETSDTRSNNFGRCVGIGKIANQVCAYCSEVAEFGSERYTALFFAASEKYLCLFIGNRKLSCGLGPDACICRNQECSSHSYLPFTGSKRLGLERAFA